MRRLIENNPVMCYANHADLYWQATLQGFRSFLQRGFFRAFLSVYSSLIIYRQERHGKRAEQPQYGQRLRAINGILV